MPTLDPHKVPGPLEVRPRARATARHGLVWVFVAFGACRTNLPDEVFYDGASNGGAPPVIRGGAAGAITSGGEPGSASGTGATAGTTETPSDGGMGGAGNTPAEGGAAGAGASGNEPHPPDEVEIDCGSAPISSEPFTRRALRAQAVDCALYHFCGFENAAASLDTRIRAYVEAPSPERLERARSAWRRAMQTWSTIEAFQFGPLASRTPLAGKDVYRGEGLRDFIYAWPSAVRCRVEDQIVGLGFAENGMDGVRISARGLYALEYLLFYPGADTACAEGGSTASAWAGLDGAAIASRKLDYAIALAGDVRERAQGLTKAFAPDQANFRKDFLDLVGYPSEQEAMNVLGWALLYVEREVKDWKLGGPAGYQADAPEAESPYALQGIEAVRANLRGFRSIFQGCGADGEGLGFDDWLVEAGHAELATDIISAWQSAQATADGFGPLSEAPQADVQALYATVKVLTDLLKVDLLGT